MAHSKEALFSEKLKISDDHGVHASAFETLSCCYVLSMPDSTFHMHLEQVPDSYKTMYLMILKFEQVYTLTRSKDKSD